MMYMCLLLHYFFKKIYSMNRMAIYLCKIWVGNIIYTANITKDLIDDMIANEDKSPVLEILEQANRQIIQLSTT